MSNSKDFGLSVQEYATQRGKTIQAVYQQMKRKANAAALEGHVFLRRVGNKNVKYLDEEAVAVLDEASSSAPITIIEDGLKENLALMEQEKKQWEAQALMLQGKIDLLREQLAEKDEKMLKLAAPQQQIDALTRENADLRREKDEQGETLANLKKTAQEANMELTAIKGKWWYKLFAGKKDRKNDG